MINKITILLLLMITSISFSQTVNIEGDPYGGNPYSTINDAINAANDGDVILISGVHTEVVTFGKSITLRGTDPTQDIIQAAASPSNDGSGASVVRVIRSEDADVLTVTIENLGIKNGNATGNNGGGIEVDKVTGLMTMRNLIIEDNFTDRNGGAIGIAGSNVLITDCIIRNNSSNLDGGAIIAAPNNGADVDITVDIEKTLIDNNVGRNGGGIFLNGNPNFGNDHLMDVNIVNTTVSNNNATSPGGGNGGGAIFSAARPWTVDTNVSNITLMLVHATFYGNTHASLAKSGIQFGSAAPTNFSVYNSIVVSTDVIATKSLNFNNSNTTDVVNSILGGLEGAGPLSDLLDDADKNNTRGRTATFAGLTSGLTDQGGSTLVYAVDENSNADDYCTASVPGSVMLPEVDQRNFNREGVADAGAFEFGGTLSIEETSITDFSVFPNPTRDVLHIESINSQVKQVEFYSVLGQLKKQASSTTINVSDLASGIYLVKITGENSQIVTKRVIKR